MKLIAYLFVLSLVFSTGYYIGLTQERSRAAKVETAKNVTQDSVLFITPDGGWSSGESDSVRGVSSDIQYQSAPPVDSFSRTFIGSTYPIYTDTMYMGTIVIDDDSMYITSDTIYSIK